MIKARMRLDTHQKKKTTHNNLESDGNESIKKLSLNAREG